MGVFCCCANPGATKTRIISGIFLCCEVKANQMLDEKPQPVAIIRFVAAVFSCGLISHLIGHVFMVVGFAK